MNLDKLFTHPLLRRELLPHYVPAFSTWLITLLSFIAVAWYSAEQDSARTIRLEAAQSREREALDDENRALAERESIIEYGPKYQKMRQMRAASDEDRLYLFESLLLYNRLSTFHQLQFTVGTQQHTQVTLPYPLEKQVLKASEVSIQFQTANYQSFAFFLEGMKRMPGLLMPMQCQLKNEAIELINTTTSSIERTRYPLNIQCQFAWLSFNPPNDAEDTPPTEETTP